MTAAPLPTPDHPANQQTFETCVHLTLQVVAAVEFAPVLGQERPTQEILLAYAAQLDRHASDVSVLTGCAGMNVAAEGQAWYERLAQERDRPVQVAYPALHLAAYLGLEQGAMTATMLAVVAQALRVLAHREGRLTH